jgi:hypothetical protein
MTGLTNFAFILTWAHGLAAQETLSVALAASHCTATHPLSDEVALVGVCIESPSQKLEDHSMIRWFGNVYYVI